MKSWIVSSSYSYCLPNYCRLSIKLQVQKLEVFFRYYGVFLLCMIEKKDDSCIQEKSQLSNQYSCSYNSIGEVSIERGSASFTIVSPSHRIVGHSRDMEDDPFVRSTR
ncbi:hypothetical protein CMV_008237 [Castanea mollissima]|uniref:Uncharacterized protein n=1 Tax=Castanea mollissima TaxID=60419 RepID=A0A8J4VS88_9ROSI|nr:hypothetical protein CMV_008237 [Castanea mollissima]